MKIIKRVLITAVVLVFVMPVVAQDQYLHIYKVGTRDKSYVLSSIDSMLIDKTVAGSYMDLYNNGRKHRVGNIANIDEFRIGEAASNDDGFSSIDISLMDADIFSNIEKDEMIFVEGGTFTMGATSEQGCDYKSDELPTHQVTLNDYYIGKYEVTQQLWEYVMKYSGICADGSSMGAYASDVWLGTNPLSNYGVGVYYPAYLVSWEDIVDIFIPRLNRITGKTFRLPTEAEWEYAARGGNKSQGYKYSGSNTIGNVAWYTSNSSMTHQVGTKAPNELGLYDMSGNVWEWCSDCFGSYSSSSQSNPTGPSTGSDRVFRGGSWNYDAWYCRVSLRDGSTPDDRHSNLGFRLVCTSL
jgi:formylglycine-generating enzyme required for sulfatase activity